ncbi:MAG: dTDP-glucose 4,6-dehydratase [Candidatus Cloacimonetes bacterium]|nr:dTDP-glucose 4,6-dehydratase [Candidatus Cloacimonadota bacterium]
MSEIKTILMTGGAGFIGSNFVHWLIKNHPDIRLVNLDALTYAGKLENLQGVMDHERHIFVKGDICDRGLLAELFQKYNPDAVLHFAAESHVDNSISGPGVFVKTNVDGSFCLLEAARAQWMEKPFTSKSGRENCRFLHVSTDEVYGTLGETGLFTEETPYAPNSPYSASKAASDMFVRAWHHTYGLNTVITNCSNNYGPRQHGEKLIPTIIRNALKGNPIPIYGDGGNVRDWLYVDDHCRGIFLALTKGQAGRTYNIGGRNEWNNLSIAKKICSILDEKAPRSDSKPYSTQITFVTDRPGHDLRYAIDATRIETELGWKAHEDFASGIIKTIDWYLSGSVA